MASGAKSELQNIIGYRFKDESPLTEALTHSSYANERKEKTACNERLEFLGDAVLEIVISEHLYKRAPLMTEGDMTKLRAAVVCEQSLSEAARGIRLGDFLLLGRGEELNGGREKDSILADAIEALIGAVFLDGGLEQAARFCLSALDIRIEDGNPLAAISDCKTYLQELTQKKGRNPVTYKIYMETGPPHNKIFWANTLWDNEIIGCGKGKTKKEAEQNAAYDSLKKIMS